MVSVSVPGVDANDLRIVNSVGSSRLPVCIATSYQIQYSGKAE